jgi:hypothetical protein
LGEVAVGCERERKREQRANGRGFKFHRICTGPDIVRANWTLSGLDGLCLDQSDFVRMGLSIREEATDLEFF